MKIVGKTLKPVNGCMEEEELGLAKENLQRLQLLTFSSPPTTQQKQ